MTCPIGPDGEVRHLFIAGKRTCVCGEKTSLETIQFVVGGRQHGKTDAAFDVALDRLEQGDTVIGIKLPDE